MFGNTEPCSSFLEIQPMSAKQKTKNKLIKHLDKGLVLIACKGKTFLCGFLF